MTATLSCSTSNTIVDNDLWNNFNDECCHHCAAVTLLADVSQTLNMMFALLYVVLNVMSVVVLLHNNES